MSQHLSVLQKLFILTLTFSILPKAQAQARSAGPGANRYYIEETFFPVYVSKNDAVSPAGGSVSGAAPTESGLGFDARSTLGYIWNNVLFGLSYNMYSVKTSRPYTDVYQGLDTSTSKSEFGPTLGYFLGNWRFALTYFMSATKTYSQKYTDAITGAISLDETYKNTAGSGFQMAIGYDFTLGGGFGISPTLVYRTVTYAKQSYVVTTGANTPYADTKLQTKAIDSELKPMITFSYSF